MQWQMLFVASAIKFQICERDYGDVQELFDDLIQRLTEEDFDLFAITSWHILVQSQSLFFLVNNLEILQ